MRGPKKIGNLPVSVKYGQVQIIQGKIISVDKVKHTVDVQGEGNEEFYGIPCMPRYVNADGTGSFLTPEVNSLVWVCQPSSQGTPFIMGFSTPPAQLEENEDPNDYRMNRPVLNEGDEMIASRGTGYVVLRKGGMIEVAGSQMARTIWIPLENMIHSFCENFIVDTPGGSMSLLTRDEDETYGASQSPTEFQLTVKEFANDQHNIFDLRIGRIQAEDGNFIPIVGATNQIVARLMVNRHFLINIDKEGNFLKSTHGSEVENIEGSKFSTIHKTFQQVVRGLTTFQGKDRSTTLVGSDVLNVGQMLTVNVGGRLSESVGGDVLKSVKGQYTEILGSSKQTIQGLSENQISGAKNEVIGGGYSLQVGQNFDVSVAGKLSYKIANSQFPLEGTAVEMVVSKGGEIHVLNTISKVILASGGISSDLALGRIVVKPTGAIILQTALVAASVELNTSGVKISTPGGDITLSATGQVHLGQPGGGGIVTTLTHPFDYITGAPILGVSTVTANGIPAPGPGIPPVFIPDLT